MGSRLGFIVLVVMALVLYGGAQRTTRRQAPQTPAPPTASPPPLVDGAGAPLNCPCQTTQEHNPVCGSNGATYHNPGKLRCAQRCGYEVQIAYYGQCR